MKVHIEGNLYLESDELQFVLKRYTVAQSGKSYGQEIGQVDGYYPSIHSAIKAVMVKKIKESTATNLKELSEDIKRIESWIKSKFEVELKEGEVIAV